MGVYEDILSQVESGDVDLRGDQIIADCPECGKEGHCYVQPYKGLWYCFRCGRGGTIVADIRASGGRWERSVRRLAGIHRSPTGTRFPGLRDTSGVSLDVREVTPPDGTCKLTTRGRRYLKERGVSDYQIHLYAPFSVLGSPRVYFPYWNERGELTYYIGRAIPHGLEPKTMENPDPVRPLFGKHVRKFTDWVVLVEGVFDHLATPRSYACLGSHLTDEQAFVLKGDGVEQVWILFDPDAREKSDRSVNKLRSMGVSAASVFVENTKKDPNDLGPVVMTEVVNSLKTQVDRRRTSSIRLLRVHAPMFGLSQ